MNRTPLFKVQIRQEPDVVSARQKVRVLSELLGFESQDQARLATAVSELARNIFQYARSGMIEFSVQMEQSPQCLIIEAIDEGPGIVQLEAILNGTYKSPTGMGLGLMGSKKLMDDFHVSTAVGRGTKITLGKNFAKRQERIDRQKLNSIIDRLITRSAETPFEEIQRQNRDLFNALEELQIRKDELSELNRELAETNRGVVALYAELDEKASSLQRANEVKTNFLSHMTHEFRTPLSSIISLTRILLDRLDGPLTAEQELQVKLIAKSSEGLLELVNDLLDLAKVEAGKVSLKLCDFHVEEILGGLRGMFRPIVGSSTQVELIIEPCENLPYFHSDQPKITQVLRNLVSNAIKYTDAGSVIVKTELTPDDFVEFSVIDTGIGIKPEHLASIFEDFSQVDSVHQTKNKGTGLGLPLSRKLARLLGGDLTVQSEVGKGSKFVARIPRQYQGPQEAVLIDSKTNPKLQASPIVQDDSRGEDFSILLVDDDEASRYVLKNLLRLEISAHFQEAQDGYEGLKLMKQNTPDLVFLDLGMPRMNGIDFLTTVQNDSKLKSIPIIVNTAKKLTASEELFLAEHAVAVISKERPDALKATEEIRQALNLAGFDYKPAGHGHNAQH